MEHYGIDLGTSNCLIAKVTQNLDNSINVKCISDYEGAESFPSVVYFEDSKKYTVGSHALRKLIESPDSTVELIKIRLGKASKLRIDTPTSSFEKSPQEISSYMLRHFEKFCDTKIENAVITVPAFFDQSQKDATMQAGTLADIKVESLIEEPTAAIMYHLFYLYQQYGVEWLSSKGQKNILVFDFGGGTLDLSLIDVSYIDDEVIPKVLAIGGDTKLGGNVIDFIFTKTVIDILANKYSDDDFIIGVKSAYTDYYNSYMRGDKLQFSKSISSDVKQFIFRLKRNLEQIKIKLSKQEKAIIVLEGKYKEIPITRKEFETHILMNEEMNIKERIKLSLSEISKTRKAVNEVLLIGGSSQIPLIKDIISEVFSEMGITHDLIMICDDFEKAVAKGAAIQAAILDGVCVPPFMHNKCDSIVARDIEIFHAGNSELLVPMGTPYPFSQKIEYSLKIGHALSETVNLKLNEVIFRNGENKETKEICNFQFFLPIYYTNDKITLSLNIDEAGLYQIEAVHDDTDEFVEFEPKKQYSLSSIELKQAKITANEMKDIS